MKILLTNDDGITCEGIIKLAKGLKSLQKHEIYILAPDSNRSGVSHSLSLFNPLKITQCSEDSWSCSGTPADCSIVAALGGLPFKPDLIISGINAGANLGTDIIYSGTAAAARQAVLNDIPAIALSLDAHHVPFHWDMAVQYVAAHLDEFIGMCAEDIFINVNIPNTAEGPAGMMLTFPSRRRYRDKLVTFRAPYDYTYGFIEGGMIETEPEEGSDSDAISKNMVSVSPVFVHPVVRRDLCEDAPDHSAASKRPSKE
ncbi:MAG: 5'/3'-nucleotidase SurE [Treponema sp.]|jgi:5'-nucleotidase|nr:5'/3'-nucleotidase SurE [Treponema sp.]